MDKCADACTSTSIDQPCGGTVLRCLTEKLEEVTDAECKKEVFYFVKMEVISTLLLLCPPNLEEYQRTVGQLFYGLPECKSSCKNGAGELEKTANFIM